MVKLIDDELILKLERLIAVHALENQKTLYELRDTIELFYERFFNTLED
jgi:hypothetical protein